MMLFWLFTKHLIVDFFMQTPYQYLNKGTYGHAGGILHAALHCIATALVLSLCGVYIPAAGLLGLLDGIIHYHVDWGKVKINRHYGWLPNNSEKYWWLLGIDQYLHTLTYLGIAAMP